MMYVRGGGPWAEGPGGFRAGHIAREQYVSIKEINMSSGLYMQYNELRSLADLLRTQIRRLANEDSTILNRTT